MIKYINVLGKYENNSLYLSIVISILHNSFFSTLLITHTVIFSHRLGSLKVFVQVVVNKKDELKTLTTEYIISTYELMDESFKILGKTASVASIIILDEKSNTSGTYSFEINRFKMSFYKSNQPL